MPSARCNRCSTKLVPGDQYCPECGLTVASRRAELGGSWWRRPHAMVAASNGPALALQDSSALRRTAPQAFPLTSTKRRYPRRRIAFWVFFSIVSLIAVLAGVLTWQIIDTLGTVNSASTPPPVISGAVLGGSPEVEIDTGHARTAVAEAELGTTTRL